MEDKLNKVNIDNQKKHLAKNKLINELIYTAKKYKLNYWVISAFVILIPLIILLLWFFIRNKKNINFNQKKYLILDI